MPDNAQGEWPTWSTLRWAAWVASSISVIALALQATLRMASHSILGLLLSLSANLLSAFLVIWLTAPREGV